VHGRSSFAAAERLGNRGSSFVPLSFYFFERFSAIPVTL
jgi:hypothetical protein